MTNLKRKISLILACILVIATFVPSLAFAATPNAIDAIAANGAGAIADIPTFGDELTNYCDDVADLNDEAIEISLEDCEISQVVATKSVARSTLDITNINVASITNTLTTSNWYDYMSFQMSETRPVRFNLQTSNTSYYVQVGYIDGSSIYFLDGYAFAPNQLINVTFPADGTTWCLIVMSSGTYGNSYTLSWNKSISPSDVGSYIYVSADAQRILYYSANFNTVYYNGNTVIQLTDKNTALDWDDMYYLSLGGFYGGYQKRTCSISSVSLAKANTTVNGVSTSYTPIVAVVENYNKSGPTQTNSDMAIIVSAVEDTLYSTMRSYSYPDPNNYIYENSFDDIYGQKTPRRLDNLDMMLANHYLVIDVSTGKTIDYYSNYNVFYSVMGYASPTFTQVG